MDNLRSVLSVVLSKIPPLEILREDIRYDLITKQDFVKLGGYYVKNYSNDELENLFNYITNEYAEQADYIRGYQRKIHMDNDSFNIFDAILIFADRVLLESDGEPVCRYEELMRWRMTSFELDEDVFTTAYFAFQDMRNVNVQRKFSWRPIIRHNNVYLNQLLAKGMVDNHFHLKGSAPQFPLSWINLMNNVKSQHNRKLLVQYDKTRLSTIYNTGSEEEPLYISYLKAALIRCYLYSQLTENIFVIDLEEEKSKEELDDWVMDLLRSKDAILWKRNVIQENISAYRIKLNQEQYLVDYTLSEVEYSDKGEADEVLAGERWFMYRMYQLIYSKNVKYRKYYNLFYAYLVIKDTIRSELVQINGNMGFDNFAKYQDRKEDFIEDTPLEKSYIKLAVNSTIRHQNLLRLEARISPKWTAEENRDYIKKFDKMVCEDDTEGEQLKKKFFYVFHFVKEKDNKESMESDILCRHYKKRLNLQKQARAIAKFRERYPKEAMRVKGIDACAKEIGCRPEVFSQAYRYLKNHIVYDKFQDRDSQEVLLKQLALTYHIGEDYLDVIDGLRAIDEAVHFLQLRNGSRIGHALALGVDVQEYYKIKRNRILITQQDYLDNLVWLYYKIKKFGLMGYDDLLLFIEQEYSKYFRLIYGNFICDNFFYSMIEAAREYFTIDNEKVVEGYCNSHFLFRISEYYAACKLRGDNPECYIEGYFKEIEDISEWNRFAVNRRYPTDYKIRYNPECAYLYYLYHYSSESKKEGEKVIEVTVTHQLIRCVEEVQKHMQQWIAGLGIGIESNPSSNYLIGALQRYDKHPIFEFYNLGLTVLPEEIEECPQIPVCVNTDDQGIFSTYLENEYALLALALEKMKDENGKNKYKKAMIYQWIDNVRKLGINLCFDRDIFRDEEQKYRKYQKQEKYIETLYKKFSDIFKELEDAGMQELHP